MTQRPDLATRLQIHVVGIGGAGMSAIAEVLASMGHVVSGSDARPGATIDRLVGLGVAAVVGHHAGNVADAQLVTVSSAIAADNPEVTAAIQAGIPVLSRATMLASICGLRRTAAVAGTHGKTTTSAYLAGALCGAGARPSWIVGASIPGLGTGARWDEGDWMVVEADESDGTFLEIPRDLALVTSVEADHLEHHGTMTELVEGFARFLGECHGPRLVCADDPIATTVGRRVGARSYGTNGQADYRIEDLSFERHRVCFRLVVDGSVAGPVTVSMPGLHNARNAAGAMAAALEMGEGAAAAASGIASLAGVARRFERRGSRDGVEFVDDYAHLPGEVAAALAAAGDGGWTRVVCVFQPHRYSRTAALWADFAPALDRADLLIVTEVYPAGEEPRPGISGRLVADAARSRQPSRTVEYIADRSALVRFLEAELGPGDLCLTLGAGDLTTVPDDLLGA